MRLFLRAIFLEVPRHLVLLLTLAGIENFDFSPLPAWTAIVVAYILEFLITFFFAEWVFLHRVPRFKETILVSVVFVVFGTALEAGLYFLFTNASWRMLWGSYSWQSLYIVALYVFSVWMAAWHMRRTKVKAALPEGLES